MLVKKFLINPNIPLPSSLVFENALPFRRVAIASNIPEFIIRSTKLSSLLIRVSTKFQIFGPKFDKRLHKASKIGFNA